MTEDVDSFDKVTKLYFEARDNANDEDAYDSPWDEDDNSESGEESDKEDDSLCITSLELDLSEKAKVTAFASNTCNCKFGESEKLCSASLSLDEFVESRNNCHELTSTELDLVILGTIQSSLDCNEVSVSSRSHKHHQQTHMAFYYHGKRICKKTFLFLHCLNKTRLCSLLRHYRKNGLSVRVNGNKKPLPSSAFSSETIKLVVKFILNTAEEQAFLLPGRVPGFKRIDVRLLPSVLTKHGLWKTYCEISIGQGQNHVGYSTFCNLWSQLCLFVLIMRPATDLCWTCQKNNLIQKTANLPEAEKVEAVRNQEQHLRLAAGERDFYKKCCLETKESVAQHLEGVDFSLRHQPCSYDGIAHHYSYDYAQQLHYPSDPRQPGPIYLNFGVCCEAVPRQVNFLIDESVLTGKGANSTISYVHYFFDRHGLGKTEVQLHADNCGAKIRTQRFYGTTCAV